MLNYNEFEEVTNPTYFNYKIQKINYRLKHCREISDLTLQNLNIINPKVLYLSKLSSISNIVSILCNLPNISTIYFGRDSPSNFNLKLSKALLSFKSKNGTLKVFWDKIWVKIEDDFKEDDITFIDNYININSIKEMRIDNFMLNNESMNLEDKDILL